MRSMVDIAKDRALFPDYVESIPVTEIILHTWPQLQEVAVSRVSRRFREKYPNLVFLSKTGHRGRGRAPYQIRYGDLPKLEEFAADEFVQKDAVAEGKLIMAAALNKRTENIVAKDHSEADILRLERNELIDQITRSNEVNDKLIQKLREKIEAQERRIEEMVLSENALREELEQVKSMASTIKRSAGQYRRQNDLLRGKEPKKKKALEPVAAPPAQRSFFQKLFGAK